jgi:hypothetical protein
MSGIRTKSRTKVVTLVASRLLLIAAVNVVQALAPAAAFALDIDFVVPDATPKKLKPAKHAVDDVFVDLDLSSAREVIPASLAFEAEKFAKPTAVVPEGDNLRTVSKNCMLTASEYFSLRQIMHDQPELQLREDGTASGGKVVIDKYTAEHCRNLYVPRRVVAVQDCDVLPVLSIPGELHIAGAYDILGAAASAGLHAKLVKLYPGASISSPANVTLSITQKSGRSLSRRSPDSDEYVLTKSDTTLVRADDEFIPSEGTEASIEIGVLHQQRESCQPKSAE